MNDREAMIKYMMTFDRHRLEYAKMMNIRKGRTADLVDMNSVWDRETVRFMNYLMSEFDITNADRLWTLRYVVFFFNCLPYSISLKNTYKGKSSKVH